jgi:hypothetical protein
VSFSGEGYRIDYTKATERGDAIWGITQTIEVDITNTGNKTLENCMIAFDDYCGDVNLWSGAAFAETDSGLKYLRGLDSGLYILPGATHKIRYELVNVTGVPGLIGMIQERVETNGFSASLQIDGDWGTTFNGSITLTNTTNKPIEWWEFTFDSNFTITEILNSWNSPNHSITNGVHMLKGTALSATDTIPANSSITIGLKGAKLSGVTPVMNIAKMTEVVAGNSFGIEPPDTPENPNKHGNGGTIAPPISEGTSGIRVINGNALAGTSGNDASRKVLFVDVLDLINGTCIKANEIYGIEAVTFGDKGNRQVYIDTRISGSAWISSPQFHGSSTVAADTIQAIMVDENGNESYPVAGIPDSGRMDINKLIYMNQYGGNPKVASNIVALAPFVTSETPEKFDVRIRANNDGGIGHCVTSFSLLGVNGEVLGIAVYSTQDDNGTWNAFIPNCDCNDYDDGITCRFGGTITSESYNFGVLNGNVIENNSASRPALDIDVLSLIDGTPIQANDIYGIMAITNGTDRNRQAYINVNDIASPMFHGSSTVNTERINAIMENGEISPRTEYNTLTYMNMYGGSPKAANNITELTPFVASENPDRFDVRIRSNQNDSIDAFTVVAFVLLGENEDYLGFCEYSDGVWSQFMSFAPCVCGKCPGFDDYNYYSISAEVEYDSANKEVTVTWEPYDPTGTFEVFYAPYGYEENYQSLGIFENEFTYIHETGEDDFIANYYKVVQTIDDEIVAESDECYVIWSPDGVDWTEYLRDWTLEGEIFAEINTEDNPFIISMEIEAAGIPDLHLQVAESGYSYAMSNDMMLGLIPELIYPEDLAIGDITLKFEVKDEYLDNELGIYTDNDEFVGIKRINVFKWFDEVNMSLPIETKFDLANGKNVLYTGVDELGTFCLVDMEKWFNFLNEYGEEDEDDEEEYNPSSPLGIETLDDEVFFASTPLYNITNGIANDYIAIVAQGRNFSMGTTEGNPENPQDSNKRILFGYTGAGTSYTTIQIDGVNHIYEPTSISYNGNKITSSKAYGDISVTQQFSIIYNQYTGREDVGEFSYSVKNTGNTEHNVGIRIMFDTMLGDNDHCPFKIPNIGNVSTELDLSGGAVPEFWQAIDSLTSPTVTAQGTLKYDKHSTPDRVRFTNWNTASNYPWDYTRATGTSNGDSAVCLYWNPVSIAKNEFMTCKTRLGLSSFKLDTKPPLTVAVSSVKNIEVERDAFGYEQYSHNPFTITAYVENTSTSTASNVNVELNLPTNMKIVEGSKNNNLGNISMGAQKQVSWQVQVDVTAKARVDNYSIVITADDVDSKTVKEQVKVPAIKQKFDILIGTGWKQITLDAPPRSNSGVDTDDDGLSDWNEIATEKIINMRNEIVDYYTGKTHVPVSVQYFTAQDLPSVQDCIDSVRGNKGYSENALNRFKQEVEENYNDAYVIEQQINAKLRNTKILPIKSDPTEKYTSGDGYSDYHKVHANPKFDPFRFLVFDWIEQGEDEAIYLGFHSVRGSSAYHTSIIVFITPFSDLYNNGDFKEFIDEKNDKYCSSLKGSYINYLTFGAGPEDGVIVDHWLLPDNLLGSKLIARINRSGDTNIKIKEEMIRLAPQDEINAFKSLYTHNQYFIDKKANIEYFAMPSNKFLKMYNSNSFTHGLLIASGVDEPKNIKLWIPGWIGMAIPNSYFGRSR